MTKKVENLDLAIKFNILILILTLFLFMFVISAGPILANSQIEFIKTLFPELPGVSINFPTVPELSQSLSEPIMVVSSVGIFIAIALISVAYIKLNPKEIYSFTDSKRTSFLFYGYIIIAGFLLFMGFANAISIGINTVVSLSILVSIGIFYANAFIADIMLHKGNYNKRKVNANLGKNLYLQGR